MENNENNFQLNVTGIKCDNKSCDYRDDNVSFKDYHLYVNMACPKCGENLLTEEDYEKTENLLEFIELANILSKDKEVMDKLKNTKYEKSDGELLGEIFDELGFNVKNHDISNNTVILEFNKNDDE